MPNKTIEEKVNHLIWLLEGDAHNFQTLRKYISEFAKEVYEAGYKEGQKDYETSSVVL